MGVVIAGARLRAATLRDAGRAQMDETERARAIQVRAEKIAHAVALLEPYRENEAAFWDHLPDAFVVAFGRPLDKNDAHDLMLCEVIAGSLLNL